jgi:dipicolinate synthase subunit A
MTRSFTFIGGDKRQREALSLMADMGYDIKVFGLALRGIRGQVKEYASLCLELFESDVLVLPIPYRDKEGYIDMDMAGLELEKVDLEDLFHYVKPPTIIILGRADQDFMALAKEKSIEYYDLLKEESFSILNAIPTAEGAIQIAMENSPITLHGSKALVLGYGRIGKSLSRMLKGIGAHVSVGARKDQDLAWLRERGFEPIHINSLGKVLASQNFIFNTIPYLILDKKALKKVNKDALIIDLASYPGGTDFEAAKDLGIRARLDLSLPGKVAPQTAGKIILDTMLKLVKA